MKPHLIRAATFYGPPGEARSCVPLVPTLGDHLAISFGYSSMGKARMGGRRIHKPGDASVVLRDGRGVAVGEGCVPPFFLLTDKLRVEKTPRPSNVGLHPSGRGLALHNLSRSGQGSEEKGVHVPFFWRD